MSLSLNWQTDCEKCFCSYMMPTLDIIYIFVGFFNIDRPTTSSNMEGSLEG